MAHSESGGRDGPKARLGAELEAHAHRIGTAVLDWWLANRHGREAAAPSTCAVIVSTSEVAAATTGRFLMTGQLPTEDERSTLVAPGRAALSDIIPVDELAKLYLAHRDITCRELGVFARELGVDDASLEAARAVVRLGSDAAIVGVVRTFDAARRRLQAELDAERELLAHQAVHDSLTGLPNRALFVDRLERLLPSPGRCAGEDERRRRAHRSGEGRRFAILFIDVDRFKTVNDVAGHQAGDELLQAVASRLEAVIRDQDTLARLGGDEFVVICPELTEPAVEATAVAERITAVMSQPFHLGAAGEKFFVSVSVGVGMSAPGDTPEALLARADAAMYAVKRRGGSGCQVYDDSVDSDLRRRPQLSIDLHDAVSAGQMSLHYQPVRHLGTNRVRCMEALARWHHPEFGPVPPDEFIPLAEESGVVLALGRWVITQALADCAAWQAGPWPGVGVAVNVSGRQLADDGLPAHVTSVLAATGLDPSEVTLEITESVLVGNEAATVATLEALRATGVRLAIDDFGTGYSSLAYLRRLPVALVKVDRSFIAGIDASGADVAIVAAMVDLAHSLGLAVVAEGVETPSELEVVRRAGCDDAQGYLLGRPAGLEGLEPGLPPGADAALAAASS